MGLAAPLVMDLWTRGLGQFLRPPRLLLGTVLSSRKIFADDTLNERSGQMRQTTTAEVRPDDGKATSSGVAMRSCLPFLAAKGSATIEFRCVRAP